MSDDHERGLKYQWAQAALTKINPTLLSGLSEACRESIFKEIDFDGMLNIDYDYLCEIVWNKLDGMLKEMIDTDRAPDVSAQTQVDANIAMRVSQLKHIVDDKVLKNITPSLSQKLLYALAMDQEIAQVLLFGHVDHSTEIRGIMHAKIRLHSL